MDASRREIFKTQGPDDQIESILASSKVDTGPTDISDSAKLSNGLCMHSNLVCAHQLNDIGTIARTENWLSTN